MVSDKHKNWVNSIKIKGIANINQNYQHRLIHMDIAIKLKKAKEENRTKHIDLDINLLRKSCKS